MVDSVTDVIINYKSENLEQTVGGIKQTSVALDGLVVASSSTEKSLASLENKFSSLERRFGTSAATAAQYEKIQKDVNLAVANNPALKDRGDDILAAASLRYQQTLKGTSVAVNELGEAHNKLSTQGQALAHAIRTSVTELALGVPPTQVLTQQFSHLTYAATGEGGLSGALKNVTGVFGSMISPMTLAIAGTAAAAAGALALANAYDKAAVSAQRATTGSGARTGTTTSDINAFVDKNTPSAFSGATLSQNESRALGEGLTKTGDIVISKLQSMSAAVVGFSNQTGQSMDESVKAFTKLGSDPVKALDELAKAFGPFSQDTRNLVQDMVAAGDKTLAWNAILRELGPTAKGTAGNLTAAEIAGRGLVNVLQTGRQATGLEKQLEDVRQKLNGAIEAAEKWAATGQAAPPEVSNSISALSKQFEGLYARQQAVIGLKVSATFDDIADKARVATEALIPQIAQLREMEQRLNELKAARDNGSGGPNNAAAITAEQNLIALTKEAQAQAARYNQQVAQISQSWGNVGQAVALQLQAMQNALPVAKAWTEAGKMKAQYEQTYNDLLNKGLTQEEASSVAAKQYELSKAAAVASAQKLVQASEDNLDKIRAEGTGMEDVLASSIAYRDAIQAGATATQAAAIAANTLSAGFERAAQAAERMAQAETQALNSAQFQQLNSVDANGILNTTAAGHSQFDPSVMPKGPLTFTAAGGGGGPGAIDVGQRAIAMLQMQAQQEKLGVSGIADTAYSSGGISAALDAVRSSANLLGISAMQSRAYEGGGLVGSAINAQGILGDERSTIGDKISSYDQIVGLQNAQTNDKGTQVSNLKAEMDWLQTLPETIARDQKIVSLQQSIDALKNSTDANTAATSATLNPLYSQGHGALAIGYYKAAGGLDMVAQGPTSGDQIPFHAMINGGERVQITPKGQSSNDNSRQVINNNNFVFNNATTSNARRSFRQFAQGFGQIAGS